MSRPRSLFRRLRLGEFYANNAAGSVTHHDDPFRCRSVWTPPVNRDKILDSYISVVRDEILSSDDRPFHNNLNKSERTALKELRSYDDVVIKEADKGAGVVILDKTLYVREALRQLNDDNVYQKLDSDPTEDIITQLNVTLLRLVNEGVITKEMADFANPKGTKPGRFYLLPKVHKIGVPGRPVVSSCSSPTERISELVDYFLKPLVLRIPSYIRDSFDFIEKLRSLNPLTEDALLVTIDVVGLYPSIPHDDGLKALNDFLVSNHFPGSTISGICELAKLVLQRNVFEFDNQLYLQVLGTAIGTKMAPNFSNIFMDRLERDFFSRTQYTPSIWWRYIDDILVGMSVKDFYFRRKNQHQCPKKMRSYKSSHNFYFKD